MQSEPIKTRLAVFLWTLAFALVGIVTTILIGSVYNLNMPALTGDVFLIARAPPIIGFLSNLTAFVWLGTVSMLFLTILVVKSHAKVLTAMLPYLRWSFSLSLVLFIDDFFMVHDFWMRQLLGEQDLAFYGVLGVVIVIYLVRFRREVRAVSPATLLLAFVFLGTSVAMDLIQEQMTEVIGHWQYLVEDGFKWVGACFWFTHFTLVCMRFLTTDSINSASNTLEL